MMLTMIFFSVARTKYAKFICTDKTGTQNISVTYSLSLKTFKKSI